MNQILISRLSRCTISVMQVCPCGTRTEGIEAPIRSQGNCLIIFYKSFRGTYFCYLIMLLHSAVSQQCCISVLDCNFKVHYSQIQLLYPSFLSWRDSWHTWFQFLFLLIVTFIIIFKYNLIMQYHIGLSWKILSCPICIHWEYFNTDNILHLLLCP